MRRCWPRFEITMQNARPASGWRIERFDKQRHDRASFDCGNHILDTYLKSRASQDEKHHASDLYVAVSPASAQIPRRIEGFYTLSTGAVLFTAVADLERKALSKYSHVPVMHLGRMAVDKTAQ